MANREPLHPDDMEAILASLEDRDCAVRSWPMLLASGEWQHDGGREHWVELPPRGLQWRVARVTAYMPHYASGLLRGGMLLGAIDIFTATSTNVDPGEGTGQIVTALNGGE